ncbi:MAG: nucleotide exchange factor GrpE [Dysgonamonadaceae bacterium]|jgi:molecular chaperone GrpE|nr:nucleotide exchange factor GrpE [Dysgonamonadaceae bacterium]
MSKIEVEKEIKNEEFAADNLTESMSEESLTEEKESENVEATDNMSEELTELKDTYVRLMAEYDNYRKRTIKEKADLIKNGGEKILIGLLPIVDDFQRALDTIDKANDLTAVKEGVELIYSKFNAFLKQNGVKQIESTGELFDADLHEAVAAVPAQNEEQKGKVIDNVQIGYMMNDKVIRHAKVVVAN